jgi:hypothetical protein
MPKAIPAYLVELLRDGACTTGNFAEVFYYIEENLKIKDVTDVQNFLKWVVDNNLTYGRNVGEVWQQWRQSQISTNS